MLNFNLFPEATSANEYLSSDTIISSSTEIVSSAEALFNNTRIECEELKSELLFEVNLLVEEQLKKTNIRNRKIIFRIGIFRERELLKFLKR